MARQDEMIAVIERWRRSGKSRIAFARESGIAISTLQRWIKRVETQVARQAERPLGKAPRPTPATFVEIAREHAPARPRSREQRPALAVATPRLRLELGDGVIVTLY